MLAAATLDCEAIVIGEISSYIEGGVKYLLSLSLIATHVNRRSEVASWALGVRSIAHKDLLENANPR